MVDYKKQKAIIIPMWVIDLVIDQLDTQLDALYQDRVWALDNDNSSVNLNETNEEIELYELALSQIISQV